MKLAITLRYLATGSSYKTLALAFRVASNTISLFIPEVLDAIVTEYGDLVAMPYSLDGWHAVARGFSSRWNFHHCVGAVDGKHIRIVKLIALDLNTIITKGFFSVISILLQETRACVCVCVCKIGPISARTLSFRHQTSRKFFSHSNFPIPYLWTAFCVPLSFVFLRKTII